MDLATEKLCRFCKKATAKYTCPRCNYPYCSTECYKDAEHRNCSEEFYRDWVQTCLRMEQGNPDTRRRMAEILRSAHNEDVCEEQLLSERLEQIDLESDSSVWEQLTEEEKAEFHELLQSGELGKYVPVWQPWWEEPTSLVTEIETEKDAPVQLLSKLTSRPPAPCVVNSVLNILCSYIYVAKLYNGDFLAESVDDLFEACVVLDEDAVFGTAAEAIQSVHQRVVHGGTPMDGFPPLLRSLSKLLLEPGAKQKAGRALREVRELLERSLRTGHKKRKKHRALKKCEYLQSWVNEYGNSLSSCVKDVDMEIVSIVEDVESFAKAEVAMKEEQRTQKKVLIEELD
ncbi:zinc finger HIT domain-containing protein 2-like [Ornithodoros turicata]|uniref:zinc finger HIT domain-containing protein 2-like n=1 Tax=Ornithodoros turicata TaxID=34597 RepID=UPI00313A47DE